MNLIKLPSGKEAEIKALTAQEDLLLRDQKLMRKGVALDRVLVACVLRLDAKQSPTEDDILTLPALDRSVLLLEIRKESYGNEITVEHICANCGARMEDIFDLEDVEIHQPVSFEPIEVTLPSGAKAKLTFINGQKERELAKLKQATDHDFLLKCIVELKGEPVSRQKFLELPGKDLVFMRKKLKETYGYVDDQVGLHCEECGTLNRINLVTTPSFLYP